MLPMHGEWVKSLAGELRSHMPQAPAKTNKQQQQKQAKQNKTKKQRRGRRKEENNELYRSKAIFQEE